MGHSCFGLIPQNSHKCFLYLARSPPRGPSPSTLTLTISLSLSFPFSTRYRVVKKKLLRPSRAFTRVNDVYLMGLGALPFFWIIFLITILSLCAWIYKACDADGNFMFLNTASLALLRKKICSGIFCRALFFFLHQNRMFKWILARLSFSRSCLPLFTQILNHYF